MATSVESPSPASLNKESRKVICSSSANFKFSPSSDKRFWSTLHSRIDTLLENRKPPLSPAKMNNDGEQSRRLKEDSMLLLRGFDSVAHSLSHLSNNLHIALRGARDLAKPPTLTEILHAAIIEKSKTEECPSNEENKDEQQQQENEVEDNRGSKRKFDTKETTEEEEEEAQDEEDSHKAKANGPNQIEKIKKAKTLAITMATKAASMARELKSIRSDLGFMQERCAVLEEENKKLRDGGLAEGGVQPDDDDLVRLQLEALLAEKSRLANENANLTRENQCLHQLVEYHQLTSQDLSASYENLLKGMCLDFSSPEENDDRCFDREDISSGFSKSLDECFDEEQE